MTADEVMRSVAPETTTAQDAWAKVDALVHELDASEIRRLLELLLVATSPPWLVGSVARRFVQQLALSAACPLPLLLEVIELGATKWVSASLLEDLVSQRRDTKAFSEALSARHQNADFLAGLLHSLVCRGADFSGDPAVQVFHDELSERAHPLAALPLARTTLETGLVLASHGADGSSSALFSQPRPVPLELTFGTVAEHGEPPEHLEDATRFWTAHESLLVRLEAPVTPLDLRSLPLTALDDSRLQQATVSPADVFARLFLAAAQGGAYGSGEYNARARRSAFSSMHAFCVSDGPLDVQAVLREAPRCEWWLFHGSGFFADVAWDLGVACIRPDGVTVVVHAATDTD